MVVLSDPLREKETLRRPNNVFVHLFRYQRKVTIVRPPQPGGMVACTNAGLVKIAEQLFPSYIREQPPSVLQYILVHCVYWNTK